MSAAPTLRVVHVITAMGNGGAERQLQLVLDRSRHRTSTIALYEGGPVADDVRAAGHSVTVLGMAGLRKPLAVLRLARLLRRERPDVVHVHLLAAQLWGIPAARLAGVPVVVSSEHSLMEDTIEGRPHRWWLEALYRALERLSTHTIAVSAETARRLRAWDVPLERTTIIENGINIAALAFNAEDRAVVRRELGIPEDVLLIAAVGRLDPVKRVDDVLQACAGRLQRGGHHLVLVGTGDLLPDLQRLAADLGVERRVTFAGARSDVARILSGADALISASHDETFGMAVVEAVASGLPVVYVQCPALEDLAGAPASAVQVPPTGPAALAGGLDAVLRFGQLRWPVPAALAAAYGADTAAGAVDELYERLVARRAPRSSVPGAVPDTTHDQGTRR